MNINVASNNDNTSLGIKYIKIKILNNNLAEGRWISNILSLLQCNRSAKGVHLC